MCIMQHVKKIPTLSERLQLIVELSYTILCNKIAAGSITIPNEASMQMQLGTILNWVGKMYEYASDEYFSIQLETVQEIKGTEKTPSGNARFDIELSFSSSKEAVCAAIEMKRFKKSVISKKTGKISAAATTDNRYAIVLDLKNLEAYKKKNPHSSCYEIVYSDDKNYALNSKVKIDISEGAHICRAEGYKTPIELSGTYLAHWDDYSVEDCIHHFMMIDMQKNKVK